MAKNPRPTDEMLAASLMEGRKLKKEMVQATPSKSVVGKSSEIKPILSGIGLTKPRSQSGPDDDSAMVWIDQKSGKQTLSEVVAHSKPLRFEEDQPSAKTLHDVKSNLIDFDTPSMSPSDVQKIKEIRAKTLWDVDSEDAPETVNTQPKAFILEDAEVKPSLGIPEVSYLEPLATPDVSPEPIAQVHQVPLAAAIVITQEASAKPVKPNVKKALSFKLLSSQKLLLSIATLAVPIFLLVGAMLTQNNTYLIGALASLAVAAGLILFVAYSVTTSTPPDLSQETLMSTMISESEALELVNDARRESEKHSQELEQYKHLQRSLADFENLVTVLSRGDLTQRTQVSSEALGPTVATVNSFAKELNHLFKGIQTSASTFTEGSGQVARVTNSIQEGSALQIREAKVAHQTLQGVMKSIGSMATNADSVTKTADHILQVSAMGQQAIQDTLQGVQSLQHDVGDVITQVKALNQRSVEITTISETIWDIASQTNLLALGAALEAAGAGEAGRRFAVVADEVGRLAERSSESARQVAALIQSLQHEVQTVIKSVEQNSSKAMQSTKVAAQADQYLGELTEMTRQSLEISKTIHQGSHEQVKELEHLSQIMQTIAHGSEASQKSFLQGREAIQKIQTAATQLTQDISHFKLS